jgi:hypothetical protein
LAVLQIDTAIVSEQKQAGQRIKLAGSVQMLILCGVSPLCQMNPRRVGCWLLFHSCGANISEKKRRGKEEKRERKRRSEEEKKRKD